MWVIFCLPNTTYNYIISHLDYNNMERLDRRLLKFIYNNNNNNNNNICLKSNIQTSSVDYAPRELTHACSRSETCSRSDTEACDMCLCILTSIWRILLMTDGLNAVWSNDRAAHTDTNPKNLELAPPQSITATRLDQLVYSPNYYIQIFQT